MDGFVDLYLGKLVLLFGALLIVSAAIHAWMAYRFIIVEGVLRAVLTQNAELAEGRKEALAKADQLQRSLDADIALRVALRHCTQNASSLGELKRCVDEYVDEYVGGEEPEAGEGGGS